MSSPTNIEDLTIRLQQHESKLSTLRAENRELRRVTITTEDLHKKRFEMLEAEKGRLEADLQNNANVHAETVTALVRDKKRLEKVVDDYRNSVTTAEMQHKLTIELREENGELRCDNTILKRKIDQQETVIDDLHQELVKASEFATAQIKLCRESRHNESQMRTEKAILDERFKKNRKRVVLLQNRMHDAEEMLRIGERMDNTTTSEGVANIVDEFRTLYTKTSLELAGACTEINVLNSKLVNAAEEVETSKKEVDRLESDFDKIFMLEYSARLELPKFCAEIEELKVQLQHRNAEIIRLRENHGFSTLYIELKEKDLKIERLLSERRPLDDQVSALTRENRDWSTQYERDLSEARKIGDKCWDEFHQMTREYEDRLTSLHKELGRPYPPPEDAQAPINMKNVERQMVRVLREVYNSTEQHGIPDDVLPHEGKFVDGYAYAPIWDAFGKKYPHLKETASFQKDIRLAVPVVKPFTVDVARRELKAGRAAFYTLELSKTNEVPLRQKEVEENKSGLDHEYSGMPAFFRSKLNKVNAALEGLGEDTIEL